jgi:hypothetical protein
LDAEEVLVLPEAGAEFEVVLTFVPDTVACTGTEVPNKASAISITSVRLSLFFMFVSSLAILFCKTLFEHEKY